MKKREGFVSNSSSASFVIHWRYKSFGEEANKDNVIKELCGDTGWENDELKVIEGKKFMDFISSRTSENADGTFTTKFLTAMMNSYQDFGCDAANIALILLANNKFEVIDSKVDEDGGW